MIHSERQNFDIERAEWVFKKVVHPGQNAMRFVEKNGMHMPSMSLLSHLHSTYVLSLRGVPIHDSNHSYNGQQTHARVHNVVNNSETQNVSPSASFQTYGNGTISAGSSYHDIGTAYMQKRAATCRPVRSMAKRDPGQHSARLLKSAPTVADVFVTDPGLEKSNGSPQGNRLEKEWSAVSQCRAMKRSSEVVSHRVDRMYFMSGNKLTLQSKYHVDEEQMQQLQELKQVRAISRFTRSIPSRKGGIYRPEQSSYSQRSLHNIHHHGNVGQNGHDKEVPLAKEQSKNADTVVQENGVKESKDPQVLVSSKPLIPKPGSGQTSPLLGWNGKDIIDNNPAQTNGIVNKNVLHGANVDNDNDEKIPEDVKAIMDNNFSETENVAKLLNKNSEHCQDDGKEPDEIFGKDTAISEKVQGNDNRDDDSVEINGNSFGNELSVLKSEVKSEISDTDKTYVKSEDYLGK